MPLVRIDHSLEPGASAGLARAVHEALVECFDVPPDDRFQIITSETGTTSIVAPDEFLGVRHSKLLVFVQVTCAPGRSIPQKKALYAAIARRARDSGVEPNDVIVNLVESPRENWSFGQGVAQLAPIDAA